MTHRPRFPLLALAATLLLPACATMPDGGRWGERATLSPGFAHLGHAALDAARNPATWGPLAAAGAVAAGDFDKRIARWAVDNTPVFGTRDRADRRSTDLRTDMTVVAWASAVLAPSGPEPGPWVAAKAKGLLVHIAALKTTDVTTSRLKTLTSRRRPDQSDNRDFPSGHTSRAAVAAQLASRNVAAWGPSPALGATADWLLAGGTVATGWARVEAGEHYPSDVLAGAALGNFLGQFVHEGFMGESPVGATAYLSPDGTDVRLVLHWRF